MPPFQSKYLKQKPYASSYSDKGLEIHKAQRGVKVRDISDTPIFAVSFPKVATQWRRWNAGTWSEPLMWLDGPLVSFV